MARVRVHTTLASMCFFSFKKDTKTKTERQKSRNMAPRDICSAANVDAFETTHLDLDLTVHFGAARTICYAPHARSNRSFI
jgi:hypothetical protein